MSHPIGRANSTARHNTGLPLGEPDEIRKGIPFLLRSIRPLDPNIMFTRPTSICITSLIAARPYEASSVVRFVGKIFPDPVAILVVVGPKFHVAIRPPSFIVDLLVTCGIIGQLI